jgi:copper homeostasis protein
VRQLHLGGQVRPGGSAKAYVDAAYVRSWRSMVDDLPTEDLPSDESR